MNKETTDQEKLVSMIRDIRFAMLTTVAPDGTIHSRPMGSLAANLKAFDGILWFFSRQDSHKNHDIETDQHVNLAYADPDRQHYVSICGRAFVSTDRAKMKELWNPILKAWFPEGLEDSQISLIGVQVESAEIWESPPSKVVQLMGFVKSAVTGKPYNQRAHGQHIELRQ